MPQVGDTRPSGGNNPKLVQNPVCGSEIENWLRSRGVHFLRPMELPVTSFDRKKSQHNQARPAALVPETVDGVVLSIKRGESLPPVVAYKETEGAVRLVIIDGNNRLEGHVKAGVPTIPCYVVSSDTPPERIHLLTVEANSRHGVRPDYDWRMRQAMQLVHRGGENTMEEICRAANVSEADLKLWLKVDEFDLRAKGLKINGWAELPLKIRHKLGQVQSDRVFYNVAHMAIATEMSLTETTAVVRALRAMRSEEEQILYLDGEFAARKAALVAKKKAAKTKRFVRAGVKNSLVSAIGKIMNIDHNVLIRIAVTTKERKDLIDRCVAGADKLLNIAAALEQVIPTDEDGSEAAA